MGTTSKPTYGDSARDDDRGTAHARLEALARILARQAACEQFLANADRADRTE